MNKRQMQMIALEFLAEKIADCKDECSHANDGGIDSISLSGWIDNHSNSMEDFENWMAESRFKHQSISAIAIFGNLMDLLGKSY